MAPLLNIVTGSGSEAGTTRPSRAVPPRFIGPVGACPWLPCSPLDPQAAKSELAIASDTPATVALRRNSRRLMRPDRRSSIRW